MAANAAVQPGQPERRKSSMMERLRRLRTLSASTQASWGLGKEKVQLGRPVGASEKGRQVTASKNPPHHREDVLDLEKLDSKLQEYAKLRAMKEQDEEEEETEEKVQNPQTGRRSTEGDESQETVSDAQRSPVHEADSTTLSPPDADGNIIIPPRSDIEIIISPPEPDEVPGDEPEQGPSDYELFLQQAEKEETLRQETGQPRLPKIQLQQPNQFYAHHDWTGPAPAPTQAKLAEIQESDEDDTSNAKSLSAAAAAAAAITRASSGASSFDRSPDYRSRRRCDESSSSCGNSGSHDFAGTPEARTCATFVPARPGPGRHVSFCEPPRPVGRTDSYSSAYHVRGCESPRALKEGLVKRKRSMREMMAAYIRQM